MTRLECPEFRGAAGGVCIECGRIAYEHKKTHADRINKEAGHSGVFGDGTKRAKRLPALDEGGEPGASHD